ncbi:MAG: hypothetical protein AAGI90_03105 [Chlamydiota bacterium]
MPNPMVTITPASPSSGQGIGAGDISSRGAGDQIVAEPLSHPSYEGDRIVVEPEGRAQDRGHSLKLCVGIPSGAAYGISITKQEEVPEINSKLSNIQKRLEELLGSVYRKKVTSFDIPSEEEAEREAANFSFRKNVSSINVTQGTVQFKLSTGEKLEVRLSENEMREEGNRASIFEEIQSLYREHTRYSNEAVCAAFHPGYCLSGVEGTPAVFENPQLYTGRMRLFSQKKGAKHTFPLLNQSNGLSKEGKNLLRTMFGRELTDQEYHWYEKVLKDCRVTRNVMIQEVKQRIEEKKKDLVAMQQRAHLPDDARRLEGELNRWRGLDFRLSGEAFDPASFLIAITSHYLTKEVSNIEELHSVITGIKKRLQTTFEKDLSRKNSYADRAGLHSLSVYVGVNARRVPLELTERHYLMQSMMAGLAAGGGSVMIPALIRTGGLQGPFLSDDPISTRLIDFVLGKRPYATLFGLNMLRETAGLHSNDKMQELEEREGREEVALQGNRIVKAARLMK